jgi:Rad3-related DNA helicase
MFLAIINKNLPSRELLVLDEAHLLETEVVKFIGISISHKKWRKYILDLKIDNHGDKYDVTRWLEFLEDLEEMCTFGKINRNICCQNAILVPCYSFSKTIPCYNMSALLNSGVAKLIGI